MQNEGKANKKIFFGQNRNLKNDVVRYDDADDKKSGFTSALPTLQSMSLMVATLMPASQVYKKLFAQTFKIKFKILFLTAFADATDQ